ncbi:MAG: hypothetical protein WDN24_10585 [Sphingomonas sp.]
MLEMILLRPIGATAEVELIVTRTEAGVLGYGSYTAFRRAFGPFSITEFDLASFEAPTV